MAVAAGILIVTWGDDPAETPTTSDAATATTVREPEVLGDMIEREPDDRDAPPATLPDEDVAEVEAPPERVTPVTAAAPAPPLPAASPAPPETAPAPAAPTTAPPPPPTTTPVPEPVPVIVTVLGEEGLLVGVELSGPDSADPLEAQRGSVGEYALTAPGPGTWAIVVDWTSTAVMELDDGTTIGGGSLAVRHVFDAAGDGPVRLVCSTDEGCRPE